MWLLKLLSYDLQKDGVLDYNDQLEGSVRIVSQQTSDRCTGTTCDFAIFFLGTICCHVIDCNILCSLLFVFMDWVPFVMLLSNNCCSSVWSSCWFGIFSC